MNNKKTKLRIVFEQACEILEGFEFDNCNGDICKVIIKMEKKLKYANHREKIHAICSAIYCMEGEFDPEETPELSVGGQFLMEIYMAGMKGAIKRIRKRNL